MGRRQVGAHRAFAPPLDSGPHLLTGARPATPVADLRGGNAQTRAPKRQHRVLLRETERTEVRREGA